MSSVGIISPVTWVMNFFSGWSFPCRPKSHGRAFTTVSRTCSPGPDLDGGRSCRCSPATMAITTWVFSISSLRLMFDCSPRSSLASGRSRTHQVASFGEPSDRTNGTFDFLNGARRASGITCSAGRSRSSRKRLLDLGGCPDVLRRSPAPLFGRVGKLSLEREGRT